MSCCGQKRSALISRPLVAPSRASVEAAPTRVFRYVGPSRLALRGRVSGRAYVFAATGAEVEVAAEDAPPLMTERYLRLVRPR